MKKSPIFDTFIIETLEEKLNEKITSEVSIGSGYLETSLNTILTELNKYLGFKQSEIALLREVVDPSGKVLTNTEVKKARYELSLEPIKNLAQEIQDFQQEMGNPESLKTKLKKYDLLPFDFWEIISLANEFKGYSPSSTDEIESKLRTCLSVNVSRLAEHGYSVRVPEPGKVGDIWADTRFLHWVTAVGCPQEYMEFGGPAYFYSLDDIMSERGFGPAFGIWKPEVPYVILVDNEEYLQDLKNKGIIKMYNLDEMRQQLKEEEPDKDFAEEIYQVVIKLTRKVSGKTEQIGIAYFDKPTFTDLHMPIPDETMQVVLKVFGKVDREIKTAVFGNELYRQKRLVEQKNSELIKAYRDLEEAQDEIIELRKREVVKSVIGGVVHRASNDGGLARGYLEQALSRVNLDVLVKNVGCELSRFVEVYKLFPEGDGNIGKVQEIIRSVKGELDKIGDVKRLPDYIRKSFDSVKKYLGVIKNFHNLIRNEEAYDELRIENVVNNAWAKLDRGGVKFKLSGGGLFYGSKDQYEEVFFNLFNNSIDAHAENIGVEVKGEGDFLEVKVRDDGDGIPENVLPEIFEPGFSTKPTTGFGIGLAYDKLIIEANYKGSITVESEQGEYTEFLLKINRHLDKAQSTE